MAPAPAARPDLTQYQNWISSFSSALGTRLVIIILETDSLALTTCLDGNALAARNQAISTAVQTIKSRNANAKVYLDGGHSAWNSAADQANRLRAAGVQFADGFFTNVSNFNSTANETNYGRRSCRHCRGTGSTASTRSSTPAATAVPPATGAPTTTPTGAWASTRR